MVRSRNRRVNSYNAIHRMPVSRFSKPRFFTSPSIFTKRTFLREFEDRREWHPEGVSRPARSFSRSRHRLVSAVPSSHSIFGFNFRPAAVVFEAPRKVLICVRRRIRKEVLHAFRKTGRSGGQRRPRFNEYSQISCRS